jgi:proteasome lid subunit RPN8/RPN11
VREKSLFIPKNLFDEMISHCKEAHPNEVCGILAGKGSEILKVYKMANIEKSPVSYEFDSREHIKAIRDMRENNLAMLAIFHSHPSSPAYPSAKDVSLAFYDDCVYVIVSLMEQEPVIKGFLIGEGVIKEIRISVK